MNKSSKCKYCKFFYLPQFTYGATWCTFGFKPKKNQIIYNKTKYISIHFIPTDKKNPKNKCQDYVPNNEK